jgi:glutamate--cysteine ligase
MSGPASAPDTEIADVRQLAEYMASGGKPKEEWRIGTEHEKFVFDRQMLQRLPYDGRCSISSLLNGLKRFYWEPIIEGNKPIGMTFQGQAVTLEPGGQFELSGAPRATLHQTCDETNEHLDQVKQIADEIGAGFLGLGFDPKWRREDVPIMPKGRYNIMRAYMPKKGSLGLDMMLRTCTVQVNLDFASEADMVQKLRVSLALQPVATALFANSPFTEGKPNGYQSFRANVWTDTDPDRCGTLPFAFEPGMGFERYVDYALDVPMYFVYRNGRYIDASGQSFRDFLKGKLPAYPGHLPTLRDWADHLTTLFPEARVKRYMEMRGADGGPWRRLCALPALWVGLLYDQSALDGAWDICKSWTREQRAQMLRDVPKLGLKAPTPVGPMQELAKRVLSLAEGGLQRRRMPNRMGDDETHFLTPLKRIADSGKTASDEMIEAYQRWGGNIDPVFSEYAY